MTSPTAPSADAPAPRRRLSLLDCVSIIVGIIIGAGFYETAPQVAGALPGPAWLIGVWVLGGVVSLVGALCYGELTTAYPRDEGGEYVYLSRAFGRPAGFLFAWAGFWIVRPGNIGAMALVFAHYAQQVAPLPLPEPRAFLAYATGSVIVFTALNVLGVQAGKWTQNILTAAKVLGLLLVFAVGLLLATSATGATATTPEPRSLDVGGLRFAVILVLFAYGGWNEISYVAAEVRDPQRNLLRSLLLGTAAVTLVYVLGNLALLRGLGFGGLVASKAAAADLMALRFGRGGAIFISLLVCVSSLGAISGMILTGSRIFYAVGTDYRLLAPLGRWGRVVEAPVTSLVLQAAVTVALLVTFGAYADGFNRLVLFTAPLFWLFFAMTGVSLFVLRRRELRSPGAWRVPLYPLTPILFVASSLFMLHASTTYAYEHRQREGLWAAGVMAVGVALSLLAGRRGRRDAVG